MSGKADIDKIFRKYKAGRREELIPLLQDLQRETGYLSEEVIIKAGTFSGLSTTKIYGLATFYDTFRFIPPGRIHIKICNGTSCYINGSQSVISKIEEETGLQPGAPSRDGIFSYEVTPCMGGCDRGPVIYINGEYHPDVKLADIPSLLKRLRFLTENE